MLSRRDFVHAGCTLASATVLFIKALDVAKATQLRELNLSRFNGGKTQGQSGTITGSVDFPFLNYFKGGDTWQGTDAFNNNQKIDPRWLAADGWPDATVVNAHSVSGNGVFVGLVLPSPTSYTGTNGNLRLVWTVTGAGPRDRVGWSIQLMGVTKVSGVPISTGNGTFSYVFTPSYDNPFNSLTFHLLLSGTAHVTSAALVFDGQDYTDWLAGKIFNRQFTSRLTQAGFGVYRFMDWLSTNVSNASTWATRKSMSYVTWAEDEYRANLSAGVTSGNVGNDYSITIPGTYAWTGPNGTYSTGGAAVDKQTMHMRFNADATYVSNMQTNDGSGGLSTLTITATSPLTFSWPSIPLSNGNPVCVFTNGFGGNSIAGTCDHIVYYVVGVSGNTFKVALTPGGTAINASSSGNGNAGVTRLPTLSIDGANKIPIMGSMASATATINQIPVATFGGTVQLWATLTYDAALNCWMMVGGTNSTFCTGLVNSVPIEVCFALCKQLGMHPHWSLPGFALDPATDYATSLASYCKSINPGWMIPHYEPANEIWNLTPVTFYSIGKSFAYWGASGSLHDWYGMALSIMGQGVASIHGAGNLGTTYEVMCGVKSVDGLNPAGGSENPRITTNQWTTTSSPTRSGYTISVASGWTSAVLLATYVNPSMRGTSNEFLNAWQYFFVNGGVPTNPSAMQNLNKYVDTLGGPSALPGNNAFWLARYQGFQSWAAGFGVNKMIAYEGGYSPDLIQGNGRDWQSPITSATKASQCVLTLATTNGGDPGAPNNGTSGNPAQVGICLWVGGISTGMTQLNTSGASSGPTFTIGQSIIFLTSSFVANQGIVFPSNGLFGAGTPLPTNIQPNTPYYILAAGLTSSQFQISATKGGSPIVFTAPSGVTSIFAGYGWLNGWIVTNVSGNSVTIDCNSTGFGTFTASGNNATADYLGSKGLVNYFRIATLQYASDLPAQLKANYDNFASAGGLFPSQYEFSGSTSVWYCLNPDVWATPSQEFNMIAAYNR